MVGVLTLDQLTELLEEIRKEADLKMIDKDYFCEKYNLNGMQINFAVSVIAVERHQKSFQN